jgi:hypothetical protein
MANKRLDHFVGEVLSLYFDRELPELSNWFDSLEHWQGALELAARAELKRLGFEDGQVQHWVMNTEMPSDEIIRAAIYAARLDNDPKAALDCSAYKVCFDILIKLQIFKLLTDDAASDDPAYEPSTPEEIFSAGIELGLAAYLVGWKTDRKMAEHISQSRSGSRRLGVKSSLARAAIAYVISLGYDTGSKVGDYFKNQAELDEIGILVEPVCDRNGHVSVFEQMEQTKRFSKGEFRSSRLCYAACRW